MKKNTTPPQLSTPNAIGKEAGSAIAEAINPLVADCFALYIKTKNFHWHLSGPHFRDYHLLFDEQADQIFAMIDILAERVRKLGGTTVHSISHIAQLQTIKDDNQAYVEPKEMIQILLKDNKSFAQHLRDAHKICDDWEDVATTSILEIFIDESERRSWFLFEISAHS